MNEFKVSIEAGGLLQRLIETKTRYNNYLDFKNVSKKIADAVYTEYCELEKECLITLSEELNIELKEINFNDNTLGIELADRKDHISFYNEIERILKISKFTKN